MANRGDSFSGLQYNRLNGIILCLALFGLNVYLVLHVPRQNCNFGLCM